MTREEILADYEIPSTREAVLAQFDVAYRQHRTRPACTVVKADGGLHWLEHKTLEQLQDEMIGLIEAVSEYKEEYKSWLHRQ